MASINNVVNVSLLTGGALASRDNMNIVACFTSQLGYLSSNRRTATFTTASEVAELFGTDSEAYAHALTFFNQRPNAVNVGGRFVLAYWRAVNETVAASAGKLTGIQLAEDSIVGQLQSISDGSFSIDVDGATQDITGLDFRTIDSLDDIITILNAGISGATVTEDDQKIVITSDTTGAASEVSFASAYTTGTFVGVILGLANGTGATVTAGADSSTLTAETKLEAVQEASTEWNFKGFMFIDNPTDLETKALAEYAGANDKIYYDVFNSAANLERDITNVVWDIKLSSLENCRMLFNKANDRKMATAYMSRAHTVNFNAENSCLTMNLKELVGIVAEDFTQTEIDKAKKVGLDIYTTIKDVPKLLTSGANNFTDEVYNKIAFKDGLSTDVFNLLAGTATKIPQTQRGVNQLVDTVAKTCKQFRKAGFIGAGTWSSPDLFGDEATFRRNIETEGFYILAQPLSEQIQSDREARKSPLIQVAVKLQGAIHSVDLVVNINR